MRGLQLELEMTENTFDEFNYFFKTRFYKIQVSLYLQYFEPGQSYVEHITGESGQRWSLVNITGNETIQQ